MSLVLDYNDAHKFVKEQRKLGADIRWDGWDMLLWKPTHYGFTNKRGAFHNGRWGMETRIPVNGDGKWRVANKNVRHSR